MQNVVIEEPYKFIPPIYSKIWPELLRYYIPHWIKKTYGIHSVETRDGEKLKASLAAGNSAILAPNHCRLSDPLTFVQLSRIAKCDLHAMASWHLFMESRLSRFMLRRVGAFSVYREGVDRQAINAAVDILVDGKRPLVIFAEGAISRHNDELMPLMDGTAFIARTAAKRREKIPGAGGVVIHPVAIRYFFKGDLEATVTPVLDEIESPLLLVPADTTSRSCSDFNRLARRCCRSRRSNTSAPPAPATFTSGSTSSSKTSSRSSKLVGTSRIQPKASSPA